MSRTTIQLIACFLLVLQGLVSWAPGRVLCIPVQDCEGHHHDESDGYEGHEFHGCADAHHGCVPHDHEHDPLSGSHHEDDACGCHFHVPVPGEQRVPSHPKSDGLEWRLPALPLFADALPTWEVAPPAPPFGRTTLRDFSGSDQVRALRMTRLLI